MMFDPTHRAGCNATDHPAIGRRQLIQAGGIALLGTGLSDLMRLEAEAAAGPKRTARAKSVVFIFQSGGPSQHETWDPKPDAPAEIRGEYGTIGTRLPGFRICEYLPKLAQRTDRFTVVRTIHHPAPPEFRNEHGACMYMLQTGQGTLPPGETTNSIVVVRPRRFEWPSIGSLLAYALPPLPGAHLPPVIDLPRGGGDWVGKRPGMLGPRYARWALDIAPLCRAPDAAGSCPNCFSHDQPDDPERQPGKGPKAWWDNSSCRNPAFRLPDLGGKGDVSMSRLHDRAGLLAKLDDFRKRLDTDPAVLGMDSHQRQALELVLSQRGGKNPFDLTQEPAKVRDLYGREEWGQGFLLARRLVEAGVRMVQINLRGWDTHQNAFRDLKGKLLPSIDHCLSGFLDDMRYRGLLDETLIVMCGEMGRTPRISPISVGGKNAAGVPFTPGRHHWGDVFPCFFAGGGVQPGRVIGRTDQYAGSPASEAFTSADLAATIFHLLGIGPDEEFRDTEGRPYRIYQGKQIGAIL